VRVTTRRIVVIPASLHEVILVSSSAPGGSLVAVGRP